MGIRLIYGRELGDTARVTGCHSACQVRTIEVIAGRGDHHGDDEPAADPAEIMAAVRDGLAAGESRKDLVRMVSTRFGLSRNDAYRLVMDES